SRPTMASCAGTMNAVVTCGWRRWAGDGSDKCLCAAFLFSPIGARAPDGAAGASLPALARSTQRQLGRLWTKRLGLPRRPGPD
ncbi:MAG TPA: hypothetical protein VH298_05050, partial [Jatrophihabitans sp.]|nr:hypothetical protein [Jatrophihabitans sp.]